MTYRQTTIAGTGAAVAIDASGVKFTRAMIQAHPDNVSNVLQGDATTQACVLKPGDSKDVYGYPNSAGIITLSTLDVYVNAAVGDTVIVDLYY